MQPLDTGVGDKAVWSILWDSNRSIIQFSMTNAYEEQNKQYVHCISRRVDRVNPIIT